MVETEGKMQVMAGVDTGGTFTDFAVKDSGGRWHRLKILSTPQDPSAAIISGLTALSLLPVEHPMEIVHGTTVGTNAFLERKGARTVLITTAGFEDVLFIGRQARPSLYDLMPERPAPIIDRADVFGLRERISHDGSVITPLEDSEIALAIEFCKKKNPQSIAICFLHAYANSHHERRLEKALLNALDVPVTCSHSVMPEFREYERLSTTLINAYLNPVVGNYIRTLSDRVEGASLYVQQSNGGCMPARATGSRAVATLLSGPAGGVQAAFRMARRMGLGRIITFDMGGTSTDVSLCSNGLSYTRDYRIDGYPMGLPIIDIHTVGAGGGSIAWIDMGGLMQVGPRSAGADPGPICYGRGSEVTVTDANLFLGRLRAESFLAGKMKLAVEKIEPELARLGRQIGLDPVETALGVISLVNNSMVQAIRTVSVERGFDPEEFSLFCYGGAAGLHACEVADALKIRQIVVPERAGVFSAQGMAEADLVFDMSEAFVVSRAEDREDEIEERISSLMAELRSEVEKNSGQHAPEALSSQAFVDCRYEGQSFELTVPWDSKWKEHFTSLHKRLYGHVFSDRPLEITVLRGKIVMERGSGACRGESPDFSLPDPYNLPLAEVNESPCSEVVFKEMACSTKIVRKDDLPECSRLLGPVIIADDFTTVLVPEEWSVVRFSDSLFLIR